jgi:hypothetical protein
MGMIAGSVVVADDGTWTGTGLAEAVMNLLRPALAGGGGTPFPPAPSPPPADATPAQQAAFTAALTAYNTLCEAIGTSNGAAAMANTIAAALVTYIQGNAQIVIPANAFGSGIPASAVTLSNVIE